MTQSFNNPAEIKAVNAYLDQQAAVAATIAEFTIDELPQKLNDYVAAGEIDAAWEVAYQIADALGEEAATPYFATLNALA